VRRLPGLLALGLVAAACGGGGSQTVGSPSARPSSSPASSSPTAGPSASPTVGDLKNVQVSLRRVAGLDDAVLALAIRSGDTALYVAEKGGKVAAIRGGQVDGQPVLDISRKVSSGSEQGLLGMAFSPDGQFLYVDYTDVNGDTNVVEYEMNGGRARASTARRVIFINQPFANHNGGNILFGPDGYLYIGMGDGGSQGDPNHNGQNLGSLLAKMLRIDPRPSGNKAHGIPPDNPFVDKSGARGEVWDYGLRNPWRFSFDRKTGDLWIGDVGGSEREEVDFERAGTGGRDYGWNLMEGTVIHTDDVPPGLVRPIYQYETGSNGTCAIIGGYVYRGTRIPNLEGAYLFSDNCGGRINAFRFEGGKAKQLRTLAEAQSVSSFGQDQDGELYVLSLDGGVFRIVPE
jgi:glucose/arabinose dehydrogenase